MTAPKVIRYRGGYRYQLADDYHALTGIIPPAPIAHEWVALDLDGTLRIARGYAWDGPSGPPRMITSTPIIGTIYSALLLPKLMRPSLEHDALYQLIRVRLLPAAFREQADQRLRTVCREDGMSSVRAWWVYHAVRIGGAAAIESPEPEILTAP